MRVILAFLAVLLASVASAQTVAVPTSVEVMVISPGADTSTAVPVATKSTPISITDSNCGITTVPAAGPTPLVNPTRVYFDDPFTVGRFCRADIPTGLPNANGYQAVARFVAPQCTINNSTVTPCPSPRSATGVPIFDVIPIINPPNVPMNLRVRPV